jgi:transcriptional regulator with XRE-family HTH domain
MRRLRIELSDGFAAVVQRHRKAQGLSRAALAAKAGLHQTYIGLLERGVRSPNLDTAQAIAKSLGFRLSKLLKQSEDRQNRRAKKKANPWRS